MKRVLDFMACTCLFLMFSCSGGMPKEREVTVSDVDMSGTIVDFIKVVDGTYTFTNNGEEGFITVQFELIEEPYQPLCIIDWEAYRKYPKMRLNAISKNGTIFDTGAHGFDAEKEQLQKFVDLLSGNIGGKKSISFKWLYLGQNKELGNQIFKDGISFEIIEDAFVYCDNYAEMVENGMIESSNGNNEKTVMSSSGENWDDLLNSYEKYVDQFIKYVKKVSDGDISAMTEYVNLIEKTTDLAGKMENAKGQLSSEQMKRYLDINSKYTKAMIDVAQ